MGELCTSFMETFDGLNLLTVRASTNFRSSFDFSNNCHCFLDIVNKNRYGTEKVVSVMVDQSNVRSTINGSIYD
jgi:hypothetical protein